MEAGPSSGDIKEKNDTTAVKEGDKKNKGGRRRIYYNQCYDQYYNQYYSQYYNQFYNNQFCQPYNFRREKLGQSSNANITGSNTSIASSSSSVNDNCIINTLKCPVCMEPMVKEIFMCETGHNICGTCHSKLDPLQCPVCQKKISTLRNYALEEVAEGLTESCRNEKKGCQFRSFSSELRNHMNTCEYRVQLEICCPLIEILRTCFWKGFKKDFEDHMKEKHADQMKYKFGDEIQIPNFDILNDYKDVQIIMFGNEPAIFVFHMNINRTEKIAYFALQLVANDARAEKWNYSILIYKKSDTLKEIDISELCTSSSTDINYVYEQGLCVGVPLHVLKRYIDIDRRYNTKLYFKVNLLKYNK